jgi:tetratricopeptide (TPR) repeat protein
VAQQKHPAPADTLEELQSLGERLAQWIGANPALVLAVAGLILLLAASVGGWRAYSQSREGRASAALSATRTELVLAMGGKASEMEVPEPANPETARKVRTEFADRYVALAAEWKGTPSADLALLEAGSLFEQLGNRERALELWQQALANAASDSLARGILHSRIATAQEEAGDFTAAARSHEAAAAIPDYPLRGDALAAAARCWLEANDDAAALAAADRLAAELPEFRMPPYVEAAVLEARARAGASAAPAPDPSPTTSP